MSQLVYDVRLRGRGRSARTGRRGRVDSKAKADRRSQRRTGVTPSRTRMTVAHGKTRSGTHRLQRHKQRHKQKQKQKPPMTSGKWIRRHQRVVRSNRWLRMTTAKWIIDAGCWTLAASSKHGGCSTRINVRIPTVTRRLLVSATAAAAARPLARLRVGLPRYGLVNNILTGTLHRP